MTYNCGNGNILREQNALRLNAKEVEKLVNITSHALESFTRDCVVTAGPKLAGEAGAEDGLTNDLGSDSGSENITGKLQTPPNDIQVSNRKDESNDGGIRDPRSAYSIKRSYQPTVGNSTIFHRDKFRKRSLRGLFQERSSEKNEW